MKLCLYCTHFYLDLGSPGYSEMTPGTEFSMECIEKVWTFKPYEQSEDQFKKTLEVGLTCQKFQERS